MHMVDVPSFLRQSCGANGTTPQSPPVWPNLKKLIVMGSARKRASNGDADKEELHDSITHALPQMPSLTDLMLVVVAPLGSNRLDCELRMQVPPRLDLSAMPDAKVFWFPGGTKPETKTVETWRRLVRSQWHCRLVLGASRYLGRYEGWGPFATRLYHDQLYDRVYELD